MKTLTLLAALVAAVILVVTPAFAQATKPQCQPSASAGAGGGKVSKAPQKIEGEVTKVDQKNGMIAVKAPDGSTHEFKGTTDTLREYKKGDRIELTLRSEPC